MDWDINVVHCLNFNPFCWLGLLSGFRYPIRTFFFFLLLYFFRFSPLSLIDVLTPSMSAQVRPQQFECRSAKVQRTVLQQLNALETKKAKVRYAYCIWFVYTWRAFWMSLMNMSDERACWTSVINMHDETSGRSVVAEACLYQHVHELRCVWNVHALLYKVMFVCCMV